MKFQGISGCQKYADHYVAFGGNPVCSLFFSSKLYTGFDVAASTEANDISYQYLGGADGLTEEKVKDLASEYRYR